MVTAARSGLHHSAVFVESEKELCHVMAESARTGIDSSETVLITADPDRQRRVEAQLGSASRHVHFGSATDRYATPASAMHGLATFLRRHGAESRSRVRSIGEIRPGSRPSRWIHYEAAINEVFQETPLTGVCIYDKRHLPPQTGSAMEHTHRYIGGSSETRRSPTYEEPRDVIRAFPRPSLHPPRQADLVLSVVSEPEPVRTTAASLGPDHRRDDVALVVHELICFASKKGPGSPQVQIWSEPERLIVQIEDRSPHTFGDPFAGLRPARGADDEVALWVAGNLADDLAVRRFGSSSAVTVVFERRPPLPA